MPSHRYITKETGIPEHIGGKIVPTPCPEFLNPLEEMAVDAPDTTQQETKTPQVSCKLKTDLVSLSLLLLAVICVVPLAMY